jgi:hypothetical protein
MRSIDAKGALGVRFIMMSGAMPKPAGDLAMGTQRFPPNKTPEARICSSKRARMAGKCMKQHSFDTPADCGCHASASIYQLRKLLGANEQDIARIDSIDL